mmetsp:Transcript_12716/g.21423  ORF Transcript_12716/g.21423 Transcript_12716/m.21423 type:complete len:189 (-) Transcript_12716:45-611(-)
MMDCKSTDPLQKQIIERTLNLMSKVMRHPPAPSLVAKQKNTVFKAVLYMNKEFGAEIQMNALRTFHPLCKVEGFRDICLSEHKFTTGVFDQYVKQIVLMFQESLSQKGAEQWSDFVNICGSITAFVSSFPERQPEFKSVILSLIIVVKEKTEVIRKNAAILLAKLAQNEDNEKFIRANHGFDVLVSLR